jgi:D-methionine transport system ATP-binding protein
LEVVFFWLKMMITLKNISKTYQHKGNTVEVLRHVSLDVAEGSIFGIVGKSGAGKSTLIRCVNLLERPDQGQVVVEGQILTSLSPQQLRLARRKMGMIFQQFNLLSHRNVYDNVALPLLLAGQPSHSVATTVMAMLELTHMQHKTQSYPQQLSGGEKQRVAIARALVSKPKILLADEATSALDPQNTQAVLQLLQTINQELGITILLISHEMDVIKQICDHVAILAHGEIVEQGDIMAIFKRPQSAEGLELINSTLKRDLPKTLKSLITGQSSAGAFPLWRIWFNGHVSVEPLISQMIKTHDVVINIHQASIDFIHHEATGIMLASIMGEQKDIAACQAFLQQHGNQVEIMGYVANDAFANI